VEVVEIEVAGEEEIEVAAVAVVVGVEEIEVGFVETEVEVEEEVVAVGLPRKYVFSGRVQFLQPLSYFLPYFSFLPLSNFFNDDCQGPKLSFCSTRWTTHCH
jgi:hypothetical protein